MFNDSTNWFLQGFQFVQNLYLFFQPLFLAELSIWLNFVVFLDPLLKTYQN